MTDAASAATGATKTPAANDAQLAALIHIGDGVFSLKNAVVANTAVLSEILATMKTAASAPPPASASAGDIAPVTVKLPGAATVGGQSVIKVGSQREIKEPADALPYLPPNGTVILDDGVYLKPFVNTVPGLLIQSASGMPRLCRFDGRGGHGGGHDLAGGKGMIVSGLPMTVEGIGFVRCGSTMSTDTYSSEAAIWLGDSGATATWAVKITECTFDDCGNGIFAAEEPYLTLMQTGSVFGYAKPNGMNAAAAGLGTHSAHDIYSAAGDNEISGSYFYGAVGHCVKTRSARTHVVDNVLMCQDGGRVLDAADGGFVTFAGNHVFTRTDRQGQAVGQNTGAFGNANLLGYALETGNQGIPGAVLSGNTFNVSRAGSTIAAGNNGSITSTGDAVNRIGMGSLVTQGSVIGLPPMIAVASSPPLPVPPSWADVANPIS